MTIKISFLKKLALLMAAVLLLGVASSCAKEIEVIKEVEVIKYVEVEVIREVEVPMLSLSDIALAIQAEEIDVGTDHRLIFDRRYHSIHAVVVGVVGLDCISCHIATDLTAQQEIFSNQDVSPEAFAPVDRTTCLACHRSGPATAFYGPEP